MQVQNKSAVELVYQKLILYARQRYGPFIAALDPALDSDDLVSEVFLRICDDRVHWPEHVSLEQAARQTLKRLVAAVVRKMLGRQELWDRFAEDRPRSSTGPRLSDPLLRRRIERRAQPDPDIWRIVKQRWSIGRQSPCGD